MYKRLSLHIMTIVKPSNLNHAYSFLKCIIRFINHEVRGITVLYNQRLIYSFSLDDWKPVACVIG